MTMPDASPDKEAHSSQSPRMESGDVEEVARAICWAMHGKACDAVDCGIAGQCAHNVVGLFPAARAAIRTLLDRGWRKPTESDATPSEAPR
jgi:hypothetical protein